jgi:hypothetical protein
VLNVLERGRERTSCKKCLPDLISVNAHLYQIRAVLATETTIRWRISRMMLVMIRETQASAYVH